MNAVLLPPKIVVEDRFVLRRVTWETYEQLLKNYQDSSSPRFTYDEGRLEIMSPSQTHEALSSITEQLVYTICDERDVDCCGLGSMTQRRQDLFRGVEPDGCFYIQNVERIRGIKELDLNIHPPPDLVIEIDITSPAINKFPIYAALGVPEIWHYADETLKFYTLDKGSYATVIESAALPQVTAEAVTRFVNEAREMRRPAWLKEVRAWLRELKSA